MSSGSMTLFKISCYRNNSFTHDFINIWIWIISLFQIFIKKLLTERYHQLIKSSRKAKYMNGLNTREWMSNMRCMTTPLIISGKWIYLWIFDRKLLYQAKLSIVYILSKTHAPKPKKTIPDKGHLHGLWRWVVCLSTSHESLEVDDKVSVQSGMSSLEPGYIITGYLSRPMTAITQTHCCSCRYLYPPNRCSRSFHIGQTFVREVVPNCQVV